MDRSINLQDVVESLLYLLKDYDCISPGQVHGYMVRYRTVRYRTQGSRYFLFFYILSADCGWLRSSAAARILRPSTTAAPTLLATALLAPTASRIFSIYQWLDMIYILLRLLVALPQEVVYSSTGPCSRAPSEAFLFSEAMIVY